MSLRDRLRSKKETKIEQEKTAVVEKNNELCEFKISIDKIAKAVSNVENPADLGNIVKEFAKFLNTLSPKNTGLSLKGDFDLGQKMLLNCILSNFLVDNEKTAKETAKKEIIQEAPKEDSTLIRKRKSLRTKLKEQSDS